MTKVPNVRLYRVSADLVDEIHATCVRRYRRFVLSEKDVLQVKYPVLSLASYLHQWNGMSRRTGPGQAEPGRRV
jgi:hypothetical protein